MRFLCRRSHSSGLLIGKTRAGRCEDTKESIRRIRRKDFCDHCLTTQELGGVSVSLCQVDEEEKKLWDAPCQCGIQCKP